jgi:hypothetical protein
MKNPTPYQWIKHAPSDEEAEEPHRKSSTEELPDQNLEESDGFIITKPTCSLLPKSIKFPVADDEFYPIELENVIYDCYPLRIVYDREKTGFEETKDF